jgi:hypothetical protein
LVQQETMCVIWLERNQTSNEPFLIVSNDNGKTHS